EGLNPAREWGVSAAQRLAGKTPKVAVAPKDIQVGASVSRESLLRWGGFRKALRLETCFSCEPECLIAAQRSLVRGG
ncbi:MAG: hypothetical protein ACM32O_10405, partial [Clostridia bacterium]